jgi:DNA-binding NtrC family response regulator
MCESMSSKLILLVENDANLRQSLALILERAGYRVTSTDCVAKTLELLNTGHYNLIIFDTNVPETKDILIQKVHLVFPDLPVVSLTDQASNGGESEKKLLHAYYLLKPIAPERLLEVVGSVLKANKNNRYTKHFLPIEHN